ncbi:MAG: sulfotransferase [Acetobacteraceae bacterium]|nr:sulfotransferase [Acetobacteraceae bacterium]
MPKLFALGDSIQKALPLLEQPLGADRLLAAARRRLGFDPARDPEMAGALTALVGSIEREASLNLFGRLSTRWDLCRFLANVARLQQEESRDPAIGEQKVTRPVFITGLPRSGTSFLHSLLMLDPENRVPRCWQMIHPYPRRQAPDRRVQHVQQQLDIFAAFAPDLAGIHPIQADSPQECTEITAHVFRSLRFDTTYRVPGYRTWLDVEGHLPAYRFHKRFLQHLQRQPGAAGRSWVLKSPDHVFALDAIRAVYPDALIVYLHRDPLRVLSSVAFMTEVLRRPFARTLDRLDIGRQVAEDWVTGTRLIVADSAARRTNVMHVLYDELIADPLGAVRALTREMGRALSSEVEHRIRAHLAATPNGGYSHSAYRPEDYGLDLAVERSRFAPYMSHFRIPQMAC